SLYQLLPTVVILSLAGFLVSLMVSVVAIPWGNRSFRDLVFQMAESKTDLGIKERVFCEPFDDVVFYVGGFSGRERVMRDVFVVDRRDETVSNTIVAGEGRVFVNPEARLITIRFRDGTIFVVEKGLASARTIRFKTYDLNIGLKDIMAALASRKRKPKELTVSELVERLEKLRPEEEKYNDVLIEKELTVSELVERLEKLRPEEEKYNDVLIELLGKFTLPVGVFLMGIIGVPLGAQLKTQGRTAGIGVSLAVFLLVFLLYYICLAATKSLCESGVLSPKIGLWMPDLILASACVYLFRRVAREQGIIPGSFFKGGPWGLPPSAGAKA
ncbi:MAG: LptF/LptG family permease, partial [Deltaproteobacteria bacterium]|nr:LptF/LptG family permease [Deltaproteobacteria bacterium]